MPIHARPQEPKDVPSRFDPESSDLHKTIVENLADGVYMVEPDRTITYWNQGAERISGHPSASVVGHRCFDNILGHVDAMGRSLCHTTCPLAQTMADGEAREVAVWLKHSDGYRKPVRVRTAPVRDADGAIMGGVEIFSDDTALVQAAEDAARARRDALTDELTGLPNRRLFDAALAGRLENLARYGWGFGLLIVDIDHFKAANDDHGHAFGDAVLTTVAQTLRGAVRVGDILARWGGDEFTVLVEAPSASDLMDTAERLSSLVTQSEVRLGEVASAVQVSVGGTLAAQGDSAATLFTRADSSLYMAKNAGRNRVQTAAAVAAGMPA
jgi:diguanylate cyclase (GGDEF)-like protein/PAS domain S-box-containing protein